MSTPLAKLDAVIKLLCFETRGSRMQDCHLHEIIRGTLERINVIGVIAHFDHQTITVTTSTDPALTNDDFAVLEQKVKSVLRTVRETKQGEPPIPSESLVHGTWRVVGLRTEGIKGPDGGTGLPYAFCALVIRASKHAEMGTGQVDAPLAENELTVVADLLFQVLRQRVRIYATFPPEVSRRYWADSHPVRPRTDYLPVWAHGEERRLPEETESILREAYLQQVEKRLEPPWSKAHAVRAASLSFDLRKSTFCMANTDGKDFADWMDELVQIVSEVVYVRGGVFDKFTGDGALIHFLESECKHLYEKGPVEAAVDCALDLHAAIKQHLAFLKTKLHNDSYALGSAIGIDCAPTHWKIDSRFNPVVVGMGIVHACRLGDKTPAGRTRLTNRAYQALSRVMREGLGFAPVPYESKEIGSEMAVLAWEFGGSATPGSRRVARGIIKRVYARRKDPSRQWYN